MSIRTRAARILTTIPVTLVPLAVISPAHADTTVITNYSISSPVSACNGDNIHIEGLQVVVVTTHKDGSQTFRSTFNGSGTAQDGNTYHWSETNHSSVTNGVVKLHVRLRLISEGSDPNLLTEFTFVSNPFFVEFTPVCVG
jgi:hypothetical protein